MQSGKGWWKSSTTALWGVIESLDEKWHVLDHVLQELALYKAKVCSMVEAKVSVRPADCLLPTSSPARP